ncbi:MAG: hypothetical protein GHCLOJNM_04638 [bacterium]|nr:hypothetical protein [bacterium]
MKDWPALVPEALGRLKTLRVRFELIAEAEARLPAFLGSTLRGGLAMAFRKMVCTYDLRPCDGCPVQRSCHYPNLFETPTATGKQEIRRMRDIPHPIVIEPPAMHLGRYAPGDLLTFEAVLLGRGISNFPYLVFAAHEMAAGGLGVDRCPFRLLRVRDRYGGLLFESESGRLLDTGGCFTLGDLWSSKPIPSSCELILETPLRLKFEGELMNRELDLREFLKATCRRLWALCSSHGERCSEGIDFRPLLERAPPPNVLSSRFGWRDLTRYSNRQKAKIKISGTVGSCHLGGELEAWWPLLVGAEEVHVGKGTVMGLGKVRLRSDG